MILTLLCLVSYFLIGLALLCLLDVLAEKLETTRVTNFDIVGFILFWPIMLITVILTNVVFCLLFIVALVVPKLEKIEFLNNVRDLLVKISVIGEKQ